MTKPTALHVRPNSFQKMKVSLATQVFSHSVAAAIKTSVKTGELVSHTALNTAEFVEIINNLFDALNSKLKVCKNPFACALTKNNTSLTSLNNRSQNFKKFEENFTQEKWNSIDCSTIIHWLTTNYTSHSAFF